MKKKKTTPLRAQDFPQYNQTTKEIEFLTEISLHLSPQQIETANRILNLHYTGEDIIPLDVLSKDIPKELIEAQWSVNAYHKMNVRVSVDMNGKFKITAI